MRKTISLLLSVLLLAGLFSFAAAEEVDWSARRLAEPVELTFMIDRDQSLDGWNAVFAKIEEVLNIKTKLELRPGGAEGDNLVKARLATGDMADFCAYNSGSLFKVLNPEQNFVDLSNEPYANNLDESFKSAVSVNGKLYGVPSGSTSTGSWLYNARVHEELGLKIPTTWDELLANCQIIKDAGKIPVIGAYKDSWTSQLILLADYHNLVKEVPDFAEQYDANVAKYATTPAALRGFEKLNEIYTKGYINTDLNSTSYDMALEMLVNGDGVYFPMLSFALGYIEENFGEEINNIGSFGQPGDDPAYHGVTVWLPGGIYLAKSTKNEEAAKLWLEYFTSSEITNLLATYNKPTGPFAIKGIEVTVPMYRAATELQPHFDAGMTAAALEFSSPLKGPNLPQITQECGSGLSTPLEAAEKYDLDVQKQAVQLGMPGW